MQHIADSNARVAGGAGDLCHVADNNGRIPRDIAAHLPPAYATVRDLFVEVPDVFCTPDVRGAVTCTCACSFAKRDIVHV